MPEDDEIYFSASGDLYSSGSFAILMISPIYLSGNYVTPLNMDSDSDSEYDEDEDELYDESPDEDELLLEDEDDLLEDDDEDSEEDELDDLNGRIEKITEDLSSRIEDVPVPTKKRPREEPEEEEAPALVDTTKMASAKEDVDMSGMSKSQRKKLKKQRLVSNESNPVNGTEKKVQFDTTPKGPTPSTSEKSAPPKPALSPQVKVESKPNAKKEKKTLSNGVVVEDAKAGTGPMAKNGSKLAVRYIGKLTNGKVFDKNTKGKPFRFTLGKGEVIKGTHPFERSTNTIGWDIGMTGMQLGGERKIHVPASVAYGSKKLPDIPPNSDLIFEVKCVGLN